MAARRDAPRGWHAELAWGAGATALTCALAAIALQLWNADLSVPFSYHGDALFNQLIVKGVLEHGWYQHNPNLGAPFGLKLYDFPVVSGDNLQILLIKAIGLFSSNSAVVVNVFFLLCFPLCAATCYGSARLLAISRPASAAFATLFALLPYHFLHGETHVFISAYYAVPIGAYLALRSLTGEPLDLRRRRTVALLAVACLVVGSAHVYYAAFTISLLLVAAVVRLVAGQWRLAAPAAALAVAITIVVAANHLPNVIYQAQHGKNAATQRTTADSESYQLKIAQMVLPVPQHRIHALAALRARYDANGTQIQEGAPQSLGIVATLGFLGLLVLGGVALVDRRRRLPIGGLPFALVVLTVAAIVIGTVGGFSSVFAYVVSPQLRAWGRIAIFIGFFSLAAVAVALDIFTARRTLRITGLILGGIVLVGMLDQTNAGSVPDYSAVKTAYASDAALVDTIEQRLPPGASVYQLPYEPFPEPQPQWIPAAGPYDLARGYLHSSDLKWSYGLMKGRAGDWNAAAVQLPPASLARAVAVAGFRGILVDRDAYYGGGVTTVRELARETGGQPVSSPDGRLVFIDLRDYARRLLRGHSQRSIVALRRVTLRPLSVDFGAGFSELQQSLQGRSFAAQSGARISLENPDRHARRIRVVFGVRPAYPAPADLTVLFPDGTTERARVPVSGLTIDRRMTVQPGGSAIVIDVKGRPQVSLPSSQQPYAVEVLDPLVIDEAFDPFGALPADRRAAAWLAPFGAS